MVVVFVIIAGIGREIFTVTEFVYRMDAVSFAFFDLARFRTHLNVDLTTLAIDGDVARVIHRNAAQISKREFGSDAHIGGNDDDIFVAAGCGVDCRAVIQLNNGAVRSAIDVRGRGGLKLEGKRADANEQGAAVFGGKIVTRVDRGSFRGSGIAEMRGDRLGDKTQSRI